VAGEEDPGAALDGEDEPALCSLCHGTGRVQAAACPACGGRGTRAR